MEIFVAAERSKFHHVDDFLLREFESSKIGVFESQLDTLLGVGLSAAT